VNPNTRLLDQVRARSSELENHYIDEVVAGRLSRRDFLRKGGVIGISATSMGAVLAACGGANSSSPSSTAAKSGGAPKKGGTLRVANQVPTAAINPLTITDNGGLNMLCQVGEFLINDNTGRPGIQLQPILALGWKPNASGEVWTFKLRPNVKFHNGAPMSADDVVYTFQQQTDPKNAANALSALGGIIDPSGVEKVDDLTVRFHLEQPVGAFPYLVSSNTYNAIIVPKGTDFANWHKTFIGTGPFKLKSYTQNQGASFTSNPDYWGPRPYLDGTQFTFYASQTPQILALEGGDVDLVNAFVVEGAQALLNNPKFNIVKLKSSLHRELSMRCDEHPFTDPRVRQAVAFTLDRPAMVTALLGGYGTPGNDSPFSPIFVSTDKSIPQRTQNIAKARQLLTAAGHPNGIAATLYTEQYQEIPELAQAIAASAAKAGVNIKLDVESQATYYGKATFGNSDWLDGEMSLLDYGGRGVPNVVLEATLTTKGIWNAARFNNAQYDALFKKFIAALEVPEQQKIAGQIQTLLLEQTPVIVPYFLDELSATTTDVHGTLGSQNQQIFLGQAYMS
jgi:peptide/nickel transport system substrate-binding protein